MRNLLLAPFEPVYAAVVRARNARYDREAPQRLSWPVVSVGNLSAGGAGKTPLVVLLAQRLEQKGWSADVLSRGYGRDGSQTERVDAAGDPRRFGDEPVMIARATRAPVFVGPRRYQAGLLAERELERFSYCYDPPKIGEERLSLAESRVLDIFPGYTYRRSALAGGGRRVHLLDDGFQHRQLARTVDIVAICRSDLEDRQLPAGRLREPLASLRRADVIVLREEDADLVPRLAHYARPGLPFWKMRRRISLAADPVSAETAIQTPAVAFCAIAHPEEFFEMLQAAGITLAGRTAFRDHHRYTRNDIEAIRKLGARCGAAVFITTEKDGVKLDTGLQNVLAAAAPLRIARLTLELAEEPAAIAQLIATLEASGN